MTCIIAIVAFASRHDKHPVKHYLLPGIGAFMNIAELIGVVYIAINGSGTTPGDAYKALGIVVLWCLLGFVWVALNPSKRHLRDTHLEKVEQGPMPAQV